MFPLSPFFKYIFKIKRRILNGIALNYKFCEIQSVLTGFFNLFTPQKCLEKTSASIISRSLQIFIISLPFRNDRRDNIKLNLQSFNYVFIDAIHGKSLNLQSIPNEYISTYSKKYLSKGSIGCIFSHFKAWVNLKESYNLDYALILEDDVSLTVSQRQFDQVLELIPCDFDIVLLGSSNKYLLRDREIVNTYFFKPIFPKSGLFAYIITKKAVDIIINRLFPVKLTAGGIDTIIGKIVLERKLNVYHTSINVFIHDYSSPSNILNYSTEDKVLHFTEY